MTPAPRRIILAPAASLPRRSFLAKIFGATLAGAFMLRPREGRAAGQGLDPFIGELALFGFNFAPVGWAQCNGQLLSIAQNTALFALLGTQYGGNGQTTFALPDLRGRVPINQGQGPGLSNYTIGQLGGEESHTLISNEMPAHNHVANVSSALGTSDSPNGGYPAKNPAGIPAWAPTTNGAFNPGQIGLAGGSQPHNNMQPYLTLNWCIALQGVFPSRS